MPMFRWVPLTACSLIAAAAVAQPQSSEDRDIVVEGQRIGDLATDFVDRVLPTAARTQFARFEDPICPLIAGVNAAAKQEIGDRLFQLGRATGLEVKKQPCAPNLFLVVVTDKKSALDSMRQNRPEYLAGVSKSFLEESVKSAKPYMAWQLLELYTADGLPIVGSNSMPSGSNGAQDMRGGQAGGESYKELNTARVRTTLPPSRMRANVKPHVMSSVVVVESRALANVDTRQLADFAFMQALIPVDQRSDGPPSSSILSLFTTLPVPNAAPQSVTRSDVAFIRALRGARGESYSSVQRNDIRTQMVKELAKAPEARN